MKGIIYKATSKTTNKCYIGETIKSLPQRMNAHFNFCNQEKLRYKFQKALIKYGVNDFTWEILEECYAETKTELKKILLKKEKDFIIKFDSYKNGYNTSLPMYMEDDIYFLKEIKIDKKEYLEFCSQGNGRKKQAVRFNCSEMQIKRYRMQICYEDPSLRELLDEYDKITIEKGMKTRNTYTAFGADNTQFKEININEDEYIKKAKEGLNRVQLAECFNVPENHIKTWRKRKIAEDVKYKKLFKQLDSYRRNGTTANNKKLINRLPQDIIDNIKQLSNNGKSMSKICELLGLSFSNVRCVREALKITPRKNNYA